MKKSTKKTIMALIIILIFGLSTIAFFVVSFAPQQQAQQEFKPLDSPIVEGNLDPIYKSTYVASQFTWLEYYYEQRDDEFLQFLDSLPNGLPRVTGEPQLIIQKINEPYLNETDYIIISSQAGINTISDINQENVFIALCDVLISRPLECGFGNSTIQP